MAITRPTAGYAPTEPRPTPGTYEVPSSLPSTNPAAPPGPFDAPADQWATDTQPVNPHIHIAAGQAKIPFLLALPAGATRRSRLRFA
jgi:hypothetical protein